MSEIRELTVYTDKVKQAIESIPQELYSLSEEVLRRKANPDIKMYELKRAFWEEIASAQDENRKMVAARVYENKISKGYFYDAILTDPIKMAWITSPLTTYEDKTKAALDKVTARYDELINMEITTTKRIKDTDGEYILVTETDPKKALVLLQIIKNLEDRIKGTAVQRQVSVNTTEPSGQGIKSSSLDMDAVERRIAELEGKLNGQEAIGNDNMVKLQQDDDRDNIGESSRSEGHDVIDATYVNVVEKDVE